MKTWCAWALGAVGLAALLAYHLAAYLVPVVVLGGLLGVLRLAYGLGLARGAQGGPKDRPERS